MAAGADLTINNNLDKTPKELGIECGLTPEQVDQCLSMLYYIFLQVILVYIN